MVEEIVSTRDLNKQKKKISDSRAIVFNLTCTSEPPLENF